VTFSIIAPHHFQGVGTQIAPYATAFCMRRNHYMIEIMAACEPTSVVEAELQPQWRSDATSLL
jgi:hypothetical protein